jgi:acylaminoacyl-peptidase
LVTISEDVGAVPAFSLSGYISQGTDYSVASNGRFAIPYARADRAGDLASGTVGAIGVKAVTDVNSDVLGGKTLAEVEGISYASSADGRAIQGWILKPPHFDPERKYPLILVIHGGPHVAYGPRFDLQLQIMAAKGYLILFLNYRGSTSYGEEFANLVHDNFPGDAYFDLISGVDEVAKRAYIDTKALFVTGPSAGGQLTLWLVGKDQRFAAAAAVMPVVNRISSILTSDRSLIYTEYRYKGFPWERAQHYMNLSPISLVDRVTTPVLLVSAEEDYRATTAEAEQYYRALKLRRMETVLMRVPGEPHAVFFRSPSHQYATLLNTIAWFDRYRARSHGSPAAAMPRKAS